MCDVDMYNHKYLIENFPLEIHEVPVGSSITPQELVGGEDIDDDNEDVESDFVEPTEKQKREVLKIHRNLGHPTNQDLGRALRHAGCKRNIVRWASKELRCITCQGRARPGAKRPAALPRCMRFNQVVGCDLIEFDALGFKKDILNVCCLGYWISNGVHGS